MLTNLRIADLRLTTAQQRSTGQNLPTDLYGILINLFYFFEEVVRVLDQAQRHEDA
jgi:hypothetical protein